ncbi:MAG: hypothetical protein Q9213_001846 [Squamulea squamosa]
MTDLKTKSGLSCGRQRSPESESMSLRKITRGNITVSSSSPKDKDHEYLDKTLRLKAPTPRRSLYTRDFYSATQAPALDQHSQGQQAILPSEFKNLAASASSQNLPQSCPGCGALTLGLGTEEQAGYYNPGRRSVKGFLGQADRAKGNSSIAEFEKSNHAVRQAGDAIQRQLGLESGFGTDIVRQGIKRINEEIEDDSQPLPSCNRCHHLLHHSSASSIVNPTIQSIHQMISESPYSYNHIYHVLDAADFPLSLVPQLQRRLNIMPQRSQNRRAKTRVFHQGRRAEISFIITRSDLLAPQKEQVDTLMPYLIQVLRDALGPSGKDVRLGNVRCVSAKRGWWTKQVKDEIWDRGGGSWMVGKVNVGKSNLFQNVFPKRAKERGLNPSAENSRMAKATSCQGLTDKQSRYDAADRGSVLPPSQPLQQFPAMPTVSHFPGTTASPIRVPFGNGKGELVDMPGLSRGSLEDHVIESHRSDLVMRQRVKPEQRVIKPGQSLLISGVVRITPIAPDVTVLAYPFVPLASHVTSTDKAIAISTQTQLSGVSTIAKPGMGSKMAFAGQFQLQWDVTKQRAGPLTSAAAVGLRTNVLPFVVFSTDILIEGCGWIELVAQVRRREVESMDGSTAFPKVDIWSPNGDYIAERRPMNGWLLGRPKVEGAKGRTRPRRSMKGAKKAMKLERRRRKLPS